jgi:AAA domain, putative AbiEii toxin, Type IV TA system/AAA domain
MIFRRLRIANWRQFREIDLEFHERLTVLTGANGAGKTTVLNLLSRHFGWQWTLVGTPRRQKNGLAFFPDCWTEDSLKSYETWLRERSPSSEEPPAPEAPAGVDQDIGTLTYANGQTARLTVPPTVGPQFNVNISNQQAQKGLHIPSHRPTYSYQPVTSIPTAPRRRNETFTQYSNLVRTWYYGGHQPHGPSHYLKETLIALAAFGYGNEVIDKNAESLAIFQGFEKVLRTVLPPSLGFERLAIRLPEVVLITRSGDFSLDAVSGGISSLIDLAWQVFMFGSSDTPFAVTIDEPENHLHPELQRTVLGTFLSAFPNVQFICATHNPFIVTSVPDSHTYVLRYGADHKVRSELLTSLDRSGSSNETLRDVLGLPSSSPTWVEQKLSETADLLSSQELTPELVAELQKRLRALGLERFIPVALADLAKERLSR